MFDIKNSFLWSKKLTLKVYFLSILLWIQILCEFCTKHRAVYLHISQEKQVAFPKKLYYNQYITKDVNRVEQQGGLFMDIMSVSGMSGMLNTSKVNNDIQVAVLSKSLETYQTTGENLTKMMEASVNPNLGQNIDFRVWLDFLIFFLSHFLLWLNCHGKIPRSNPGDFFI